MNALNPATASLADLHYRLGKLIEDRPGVVANIAPDGPPHDSNKRYFAGLAIDCVVRRVNVDVSPEIAARADREWAEIPDDLDELKQWMMGNAPDDERETV